MIWAWERSENLSFIDPDTTGVAFLAGIIRLDRDQVKLNKRIQELVLPTGTKTLAVIRLEVNRSNEAPALSAEQQTRVANLIESAIEQYRLDAIQIDFDALESERPFYSGLLGQLRQLLPANKGISMTALASWCIHDYWLDELPVDEIVPMFFCMGADETGVLNHLRSGKSLASSKVAHAAGLMCGDVATRSAERERRLRARLCHERLYLFSMKPWTSSTFNETVAKLTGWN